MSKKKFANLGLDDALADFVTDTPQEEKPKFNPLTDKKPRARKASPKKEEEKNKTKVSSTKPKNEEIKTKTQPEKKEEEPRKKLVASRENPFSTYDLSDAPKDFRSHSALFSMKQRLQLSDIVFYKKYKENPKYTIQFAIYQALEELFENRQPLTEFPDDFEPYSPGFSVSQWGDLEKFVAEIKFKENKKYALMYAIYEALKVYIDSNPINK